MDVKSADGTTIAYDRSGSGPAVVLVQGGFSDRTHPIWAGLAAALSDEFTVYNYDRRGRGGSSDNESYEVEREIEDLAAVIEAAGGSAAVFGGSSGGALALRAAAAGLPITKLAVYEPPFIVDESRAPIPEDFREQLATLVAEGKRGEVVERFMVEAAEVPAEMVGPMKESPYWEGMTAVAHTLVYEAAVCGPGNKLPAGELGKITAPTLALSGGNSGAWMQSAGKAVAETVPNGEFKVLEGHGHDIAPEALAPPLAEYFRG
ncbi:alpha/beta fold hydrolase [Planobispora takensis]|uniref:Alpha/beta hydrolase n=1 Tax=Planobispora takensis TaxID=1367882 RepID=A0A8J3SZE0_9ACTN|nr:alpha/beta hydrolase [Planobispora takensis]GII02090.1 alpha/beta hydrolase [Planobispora takensis]